MNSALREIKNAGRDKTDGAVLREIWSLLML
jgi:hypothetical protein